MAVDAVLELYCNVADGLVVYPRVIARRVDENLPFMATENVLMEAVKHGGDRQAVHERIRQHSQAAARRVKEDGLDNNLIELMGERPRDTGQPRGDSQHAQGGELHRPLPGAGRRVHSAVRGSGAGYGRGHEHGRRQSLTEGGARHAQERPRGKGFQ